VEHGLQIYFSPFATGHEVLQESATMALFHDKVKRNLVRKKALVPNNVIVLQGEQLQHVTPKLMRLRTAS